MSWESWIQNVLLMLIGAWIYSRGAQSGSVIPGEAAVKSIIAAISERVKGNGKTIDLPRVTS